jgi:Flp pilus assembly protein protease CpaA
MPYPSIAIVVIAIVLASVCAVTDWRYGVIPNRLTLPVLVLAPVLHAFAARGLRPPFGGSGAAFAALVSVVSAGLCALVPLLLFRFRLAGGGDAKLLAALGALLLPGTGLAVEFFAFASAAFFIPARLAYHGRLFATLGRTLVAGANLALPVDRRRQLPADMSGQIRLGPFIVVGTLVAPLFLRMGR